MYSGFLLFAVRGIDNAELVGKVRKLRGDTNTSIYTSGTKKLKVFRKMFFLLVSSSSAYCLLGFLKKQYISPFYLLSFFFFIFFLKFLISFCCGFVQDQMLSACADEYLSANVI